MTLLWTNNASTTISGSITPASTTVSLSAGTGTLFPSPTGGNYFKATFYDQATKSIYEIVHVTARSADVCTIVRGQEGTTAQAWNAGDLFANLVTAGTLNSFVQAGTGPADTSVVYVGTDVSTTPGLIICNTNPVPPSYAVGMVFSIKAANTTPGATQVEFNGLAAQTVKRTDGSDTVGGNIVAGQDYIFVWNGTNFNSTIPPTASVPPQTTFYVRTDGNDNNSGFANTSAAAFRTPQGAINAIKSRYISQNTITVRVADGSYIGGWGDSTNYIASWSFIGNTTTPGNVLIDASSTNLAVFPPGAPAGVGVESSGAAHINVQGFTFQSYLGNLQTNGGVLSAQTCTFTTPTSGGSVLVSGAGNLSLTGNFTYTGTASCQALFQANAGSVYIGSHGIYGSAPAAFHLQGTVSFSAGTGVCSACGTMFIDNVVTTFTGTMPTTPAFLCEQAGGMWNSNILPGSTGVVTPPGWAA